MQGQEHQCCLSGLRHTKVAAIAARGSIVNKQFQSSHKQTYKVAPSHKIAKLIVMRHFYTSCSEFSILKLQLSHHSTQEAMGALEGHKIGRWSVLCRFAQCVCIKRYVDCGMAVCRHNFQLWQCWYDIIWSKQVHSASIAGQWHC